jgi:hypothetical protein
MRSNLESTKKQINNLQLVKSSSAHARSCSIILSPQNISALYCCFIKNRMLPKYIFINVNLFRELFGSFKCPATAMGFLFIFVVPMNAFYEFFKTSESIRL